MTTGDNPLKLVKNRLKPILMAALFLVISSCSTVNNAPILIVVGPNPTLPLPHFSLIPTVNIATAKGWAIGSIPAAAGLVVASFARDLDHPRWLYVLPNGDVLVAETNSPMKPDDNKGIKSKFKSLVMKKAGASVISANRITLLRDSNGDGVVDVRSVFLEGLNSPFGMALVGDELYIADSDAVLKFPYHSGELHIASSGVKLLDLPAGTINHHWTKNLIPSLDGSKLYVTVGSNSNVAENGMEVEINRAAIWEVDLKTGVHSIFASGLRNPNGLAWEKSSHTLWAVVNERDEMGDNLVPDYLTSVKDRGFYGWPYSYFGQHIDERVRPQNSELVAKSIVPDYALGAHTASLGLVSSDGNKLSLAFSNGMFIGQHGSWNRIPKSGYKVIFVVFDKGKPTGMPIDILTGFLSKDGEAFGRPVGVAIDKQGALLVADDVGNIVWRVTKSKINNP